MIIYPLAAKYLKHFCKACSFQYELQTAVLKSGRCGLFLGDLGDWNTICEKVETIYHCILTEINSDCNKMFFYYINKIHWFSRTKFHSFNTLICPTDGYSQFCKLCDDPRKMWWALIWLKSSSLKTFFVQISQKWGRKFKNFIFKTNQMGSIS